MDKTLADLLNLLVPERIERNIFRGESRDIGTPQVFGGQVLAQALSAATTRAGDFLGRDVGFGEGDLASLVVLEASPIEDIENTQRIDMVIHHGRVVDRESVLAGGG